MKLVAELSLHVLSLGPGGVGAGLIADLFFLQHLRGQCTHVLSQILIHVDPEKKTHEGGKASVHPEKAFEFCLRGFGWLVRHVLEKLSQKLVFLLV